MCFAVTRLSTDPNLIFSLSLALVGVPGPVAGRHDGEDGHWRDGVYLVTFTPEDA